MPFPGNPDSKPFVPESFERDLRAWSMKMTGGEHNYRVIWGGNTGNFWIQERISSDKWRSVLIVQDHESPLLSEDNPRPFRQLDHRVFADLAEASLAEQFGTGDRKEDLKSHTKRGREAEILRKKLAHERGVNRIYERMLDMRGIYERARRKAVDGHAHGYRAVHQVPG